MRKAPDAIRWPAHTCTLYELCSYGCDKTLAKATPTRKFSFRLRVPEGEESVTVGTVATGDGHGCKNMKAPS